MAQPPPSPKLETTGAPLSPCALCTPSHYRWDLVAVDISMGSAVRIGRYHGPPTTMEDQRSQEPKNMYCSSIYTKFRKQAKINSCLRIHAWVNYKEKQGNDFHPCQDSDYLCQGGSDWERQEGTFPATDSSLFLILVVIIWMLFCDKSSNCTCLLLDLFSVNIILHYKKV